MKTRFDLENVRLRGEDRTVGDIAICVTPDEKPFVMVHIDDGNHNVFMKEKDLELFAVNILKAINSKRVLQGKVPYYKLKKHKYLKPRKRKNSLSPNTK